MEGDAQGVIDAVNSQNPDWSSMGMLVEDIKHELQTLQQWQLSFVRREGNRATHTLANLATRTFINNMWLYGSSDCIVEILRREQFTPLAMRLNQWESNPISALKIPHNEPYTGMLMSLVESSRICFIYYSKQNSCWQNVSFNNQV